MPRHFLTLPLAFCLAAACAAAAGAGRVQTHRLSDSSRDAASGFFATPFLGYIPGSAPNQLRPLLGIPGAARVGQALLFPDSVTLLHLSPQDRYALVEQSPDSPIGIALLAPDRIHLSAGGTADPISVSTLPHALPAADLAAFSPSGSACVLYSSASGRLQVWSGLPDSPRLALDAAASDWGVEPRLLAVSDDARALLAADASGRIYLLPAGASPVPLHTSPAVSALTFLPAGADAVVADRSLNTLVLLRQVNGNFSLAPLASESDGLAEPDFAEATADARAVLVASADHTRLWEVPLSSGSPVSIDLPISPASLHRLPGAAFLLSSAENQPAWIFEGQPDHSSVYFVPNEVSPR
ncbi:MAG TPA: hypothetical protein VG672_22665 [Bryobacteraceae bacterium]|nr:hypothetical protein [Bryobacteraceae bacterium]